MVPRIQAAAALTLLIGLGLLATSCGGSSGDPPPDGGTAAQPITVTINNKLARSIFVPGDNHPFSVEQNGKTLATSLPPCGLACSGCAAQCKQPTYCDPAPCYLEIPAGKSLSVQWSPELHESRSCSCKYPCYQPAALVPGAHTFVIPYDHELDQSGIGYTKLACSSFVTASQADVVSWTQSAFGTSSFKNTRTYSVTYTPGQAIVLDFD